MKKTLLAAALLFAAPTLADNTKKPIKGKGAIYCEFNIDAMTMISRDKGKAGFDLPAFKEMKEPLRALYLRTDDDNGRAMYRIGHAEGLAIEIKGEWEGKEVQTVFVEAQKDPHFSATTVFWAAAKGTEIPAVRNTSLSIAGYAAASISYGTCRKVSHDEANLLLKTFD
ncbi:MAG: hypothetical protein EOO70_02230 [Myxococcaceae bacterium]|nr:MAG: hypothetical protein EOO70_02230 [Myxococcaceae bacterium]